MDNEYLQNMMGSPYVTEGAFDRLKAKGAQAMGAFGAMTGQPLQNPTETKVNSLWNGFESSLKKVMSDWKTQVSPKVRPADKNQVRTKKYLDSLAQVMLAQPKLKLGIPKSSKLKLQEGIWDFANRDVGLNKALSSNNPQTILEAYKKYVVGLFQSFMRDAVKMTGLTAVQIYSVLSKIKPANMKRIILRLNGLQGKPSIYDGPVPPVLSKPTPPVLSPLSAPVSAPPPTPKPTPPTPKPTPPVAKAPTTQPSTSAASNGDGGGAGSGGGGNGFDIPAKDMPYVIIAAFKVIINAVKSDWKHALGLFGVHPKKQTVSPYPELATQYGVGPYVTKDQSFITENKSPSKSNKPKNDELDPNDPDYEEKKAEIEAAKYKEYKNEFVYNFHSRHSKFPGQFRITVTPVDQSTLNIEEIPGAQVEVTWVSEGKLNSIYVIEKKNGIESKSTLIAKFYDHEVSAKAGATTPGHSNFFSIDKIVQESNPYFASKLSMATPQALSKIKSLEDEVHRALLVLTHRKTMAFVSKGLKEKKAEKLGMADTMISDNGTLTYTDPKSGKKIAKTQEELKEILKGPLEPSYILRNQLEAIGYMAKFPNQMPTVARETPIWTEVKGLLLSKSVGIANNDAKGNAEVDKIMANAWIKIKEKNPMASVWPEDANITSKQFYAICNPDKTSTAETPDTHSSASTNPSPSSVSEPVSSPVSKPAGKAPKPKKVTNPVSTNPTAPVSTTAPTEPVSNADQDIKKWKATPGSLKLNGKDFEWTNPVDNKNYTVSKSGIEQFIKQYPLFAHALYHAEKNQSPIIQQFKDANKSINPSEQPPIKEHVDLVNPFTWSNFL